MALPNYKDVIDLIKAGATIEAQEKIMLLRQGALDLQEENLRLREQVKGLEARVRDLQRADGEPCPRCHARTWAVESIQPDRTFGKLGGSRHNYKCSSCGLKESKLVGAGT